MPEPPDPRVVRCLCCGWLFVSWDPTRVRSCRECQADKANCVGVRPSDRAPKRVLSERGRFDFLAEPNRFSI